jgi:3-deoxy-D-manno-octulosonic-acid transferase
MLKKLEGVGGQNPIDAAKLGCKVYHGPYVYNFKEVYEILEKNNITKKINSPLELGNNLEQDFNKMNKADNQITHSINRLGQKILVDTMKYVNKFLMNEIK